MRKRKNNSKRKWSLQQKLLQSEVQLRLLKVLKLKIPQKIHLLRAPIRNKLLLLSKMNIMLKLLIVQLRLKITLSSLWWTWIWIWTSILTLCFSSHLGNNFLSLNGTHILRWWECNSQWCTIAWWEEVEWEWVWEYKTRSQLFH